MNLIISGASGFLGTNFVSLIFKDKNFLSGFKKIILVDTLQYGIQKIDPKILKKQ